MGAMAFAKYALLSLPEPLRTSTFQKLKTVQWMNEKASHGKAYDPTAVEHIANVITHGVWILPSTYGTWVLVQRSQTWPQLGAALIYGLSLILIFTMSTVFHSVFYCGHNKPLKDLLHRGDRAMIYIFIAGSYFPWLVLQPLPPHTLPSNLWWFIWVLAFFGIVYQQLFHEKYKRLETCIYIVVGVCPSLIVYHYKQTVESGDSDLSVGGLLYLLGVVFFKSDGSIPFAHAIWHLFVAGAAATHYFAILNHLYS